MYGGCVLSPHSLLLRVFHLTLWTRHLGWHRTLSGLVQSHWGAICRDSSQRLCVSISRCRACATKVFCGLHFFIRNGVCADKTERNSYFRRKDLWTYFNRKVVKAKIDLPLERAPSTSLRIVNHHLCKINVNVICLPTKLQEFTRIRLKCPVHSWIELEFENVGF